MARSKNRAKVTFELTFILKLRRLPLAIVYIFGTFVIW